MGDLESNRVVCMCVSACMRVGGTEICEGATLSILGMSGSWELELNDEYG